jgi:hypothetical protein
MNFAELKQQIIDTLNKDAKNADELLGICAWALSKSKRLISDIEEQEDLKNESELNSLENQSNEC